MDLYHPDSKIVVGWNNKAGCTVVLKIFLHHCGLLEKAETQGWVHDYRDAFLTTPAPAPEDDDSSGLVRIKFVRNPFSRAVSSYLHFCRLRTEYRIFSHVPHFSFEVFLRHLTLPDVEWDVHFLVQYRQEERYHEIVRIEEMDTVMPILNNKYGLDLEWKFSSHHHITKQPSKMTQYQGQKDFSKTFYEIGSYKQFYTDANRRLVQKIYADDFAHYGYTYQDFVNEDI